MGTAPVSTRVGAGTDAGGNADEGADVGTAVRTGTSAGTVGVQASVPLPATAASVAAARRHLRAVLADRSPAASQAASRVVPEAVSEAVLADAEVCVSELVTNAVLHAGSGIVLTVTTLLVGGEERLRLTVRDGSPTLPRWVPHTLGAGTGRGLTLISALASAHGAQVGTDAAGGAGGKDVWCELTLRRAGAADAAPEPGRTSPSLTASSDAADLDDLAVHGLDEVDPVLAAQWADAVAELLSPEPEGRGPDGRGPDALRPDAPELDGAGPGGPGPGGSEQDGPAGADSGAAALWLLDYPVALGVRMREHRETVLRELQVMVLGAPVERTDVAGVIEGVRAMLDALYGRLTPVEARALQALVDGRERIDLAYPRLPEHLVLIERWRACLRDLEGLSRSPRYASLATPAEVEALETWIVGEISRQLDGAAARPWPGRTS